MQIEAFCIFLCCMISRGRPGTQYDAEIETTKKLQQRKMFRLFLNDNNDSSQAVLFSFILMT